MLFIIFLSLTGCYSFKLAYEQNNLFNARQPIQALLDSSTTHPDLKKKLQVVRDILNFAQKEGLNAEGAYRFFIPMQRREISYLFQVAPADRLEAVKWWFPIVGSVPYLGFFDRKERDEQAKKYVNQGFDVYKSSASAYSSLGWFDDPIYESMLNDSRGELAELLFHELTHRTLWIPGAVEFNENLASFIGEALTVKYLRAQGFTKEITQLEAEKKDRQLFFDWLKGLSRELNTLYESKKTKSYILSSKDKLISHFIKDKKPRFEAFDFVGNGSWNNARILASTLYSPDLSLFSRVYTCTQSQNVGDFLKILTARLDGSSPDPFAVIAQWCAEKRDVNGDRT